VAGRARATTAVGCRRSVALAAVVAVAVAMTTIASIAVCRDRRAGDRVGVGSTTHRGGAGARTRYGAGTGTRAGMERRAASITGTVVFGIILIHIDGRRLVLPTSW
jgi:hypothetical protein